MKDLVLIKKEYKAPVLEKIGSVTCITKKVWGGTDGHNSSKRDNGTPAPS